MKKCDICNAFYDDIHNVCPTCGVQLKTNSESENHSVKRDDNPNNPYTNKSEFGHNGWTNPTNEPAYRFITHEGATTVFNGAVSEANTQQFYQSRFTKIIRAIFSSEPYQLGHTSYVTVFRIEEHTANSYPEQAQDIVLFGGVQNILAPGDDITVRTTRRRNRYVARNIFNHSINRNVRVEGNVPAWLIRSVAFVVIVAIVTVIALLVYGISAINFTAIGDTIMGFVVSLIPTILTVGLLWYIIKAFFKR